MANRTAILAVRILADSKPAVQGFNETEKASASLEDRLGKMAAPAAVALGAIAALGATALNSASELQQAAGAVESVFGEYAGSIEKFASGAADRVGLAASQYDNLAAVLGAQLKNLGTPMEDLSGQTNELIELGADLAATFGGTTADAVAAVSSLLRGERDPIERYAVSLKQVDIDARKAALGLDGLEGEAAKSADTQATLSLLYEQTASSAGRFAAEADTLAGAQARATANWEEASAELGTALLPYMTDATRIATDLAGVVTQNSGAFLALAGIVALAAGAILIANGAIKAYQTIVAIATGVQWLWNIAMTANPIGLLIVAIGLVIAIIAVWIIYWDDLMKAAEPVFNAIGEWWEGLVASFENGFDQIVSFIEGVLGWFDKLWKAAGGLFEGKGWQWGGDASSARAAAAPAMFARAAVSPEAATMSTFSTAAMSPAPAALRSMGAPTVQAGNTYNVTVQGAVDKDGTARTIRDVLQTYDKRNGYQAAAGGKVR